MHRVLAVGAGGLDRELRDVGIEVVNAGFAAERMAREGIDGVAAAGNPQAVVAGVDPQLTYLRIAAAADCIRAGARFIATNRDPVYPTERGLRPGAGSIVSAIEVACGVTPVVIGKPEPLLMEQAAHAVGRDPKEAIVIGDGIVTDLAAANAVGARTILMLTGVTTAAGLEALLAEDRPFAVAADAAELAWRCSGRIDELESESRPGRPLARGARGPGPPPGGPGVEGLPQRCERRLIGERDVEREAVDRPELRQRQSDVADGASVLLGERDVGDGRVVRGERDRHARRETGGPADARRATGRCRPGRSRSGRGPGHAARRQLGDERRVVRRSRAVGDPLRLHRERPPDLAAPPHSPAWMVIRRPPARAASNARPWSRGSGNAASGPARSQPVRPRARKRDAASARRTLSDGSWDRRAVAIRRTTVPVRAAASSAPRTTASMPSASDSPRATWSSGPTGSRRSGRPRPPWSRRARP